MNRFFRRRIGLFFLMILFSFVAFGQQSITGKILDKISSAPVGGATLKLLNEKDSVIKSTSSDKQGSFAFQVSAGKYLIKLSNIGHQPVDKQVTITDKNVQTIFLLDPSEVVLEEIEITAGAAVALKGDTMEFDAKKFSTREFADADELIAQIPGVELDEEGNVKAHGENVTKIIVDGKEFFSTDPRIALKTLPAEIIDKVQIIDEKSEQAKFSGFDDGQRRKVINIVTKPDKKRGLFGKAASGYGDHNKFQLNSSINRFQDDQKIAVNLMGNNVNETNFAEQGRGGSRRGNNNTERGLSDTYAAAINYNNLFLNKKMDVSGDYNFRSSATDIISNSETEYILGTRANQLQQAAQTNSNKDIEHRANARIRWTLDSAQRIDFSPNLSYTSQGRSGQSASSSFRKVNDLINQSNRSNNNDNSNFNFGGDLTYMYRFRKSGRTVSVNVSGNKSTNDALGKNLALTQYYKEGLVSRIDTNNNQSVTNGYGSGFSSRLALTENLSQRTRLQLNYSFRNTTNYSDRQTFEFLAETGQLGELSERLSNEFRNDYNYHKGGLSLSYNKKDSLRIQVGLSYQHGIRNNDRTFPINLVTKADFGSFHPELSVTYNFNKERRLEFNYNTNTNTPTINQLQDYVNNQNELRISNGNPNLEQEYNHSVKVQYKDVKRTTGQSFNSSLDFNYTNDKIVNSVLMTDTAMVLFDDVVLGAGGQYTVPVNVDGAYSVRLTNSFGVPIKKWKLNLNLNNSMYYNSNFAVLNGDFLNGYSYGLQQRVGLSTNINKRFVSGVNYRINLTFTNNPIATTPTYKVYSHTLNHTLNYEFLKSIVFNSSLLYIYNSGVLNAPGTKTLLWNASLGKKLFKRQNAEIALKAFDIFNNAQNINRRVTDIAVTNVMSNTLARYFMLSLNYNLRNFGK
ncbi:outer membrane beta-barrel protein [Sphingobacterium psychroaquaticum]|uniref:CarboxypepD_reg-like domain-containing protein n=1 Tax=Sphingobacterium psychroaquaticum TaxID=561061 RepID=A0A1X7KIJ3_9SPHI|nr:outer membrane beta-barrel protein [Sphingobacterium psychroaquaticum]SMG40787.1 CarboxypepD_reg-like domain-containing protein [Sphingobacterium psychroaquaticum]